MQKQSLPACPPFKQNKGFDLKEKHEGGYVREENHEILGSTPWGKIKKRRRIDLEE